MSSVNSPKDRNSSDEQVRRQRETYQQRETETAKKHSNQVKTIAESHQAEIEQLKASHSEQLQEIKERTQDTLSRRDMKYQKEIGDLRELHHKQLQRLATEAAGQQERTETTLKGEIERVQKTNEQQKSQIRNAYEGQIKQRDERYGEFHKHAATTMQQHESDTRKKLTDRHQKELGAVVRDRNDAVASHQRKIDDVRQAADEKLRATQRGWSSEKERLLATHTTDVKSEQANTQAQMEVHKEKADLAVRKMRDRYLDATEKNRNDSQSAREKLADSVNERVNDRVTSLEQENKMLKGDITRTRVKAEGQKSVELQNLRDNMQANIEQLETMRKGVVEEQNKKVAQDLGKIHKDSTETLQNANKFYQDKIAEDKLRNDQRFTSRDLEGRKLLAHEKTSSETRFEKLKSFNDMEQGKMRAYFDRASETLKDNFDSTLKEMRERNQKEQDQIFANFHKQAQENDTKFQQKLGEVAVKYERQISELQEQHQRDMKGKQSISDRQRKELEKKSQMEVNSLKTQYEHRISRLQEGHKRDIETLQRKQEETLANLTKTRQT